jgi:thiamine-phosphate pyrophosphorylase
MRAWGGKMWLYLISNRLGNPRGWSGEVEKISAASAAGCQLIQIRERDLAARLLCQMTREVIAVARPSGARVLVNDRLDVALASGADGVHLRTTSLPAGAVREVRDQRGLGSFLIGVSTHSLREAQLAEQSGATFIVSGPVFSPNSKLIDGPPMGLDRFEKICRHVSLPVFALGGIGKENYREVMAAGAAGIAAIGLFQVTPGLSALVSELLGDRPSGSSFPPSSR